MTTTPTGLEHVTPVKLVDTSVTERAAFRRCRRYWFLGTVHRLGTVLGNRHFWFGTLVHKGLETYYRSLKTLDVDEPSILDRRAAEEFALEAYWKHYDTTLEPIQEWFGALWWNVLPDYQELGALGQAMLEGYFAEERQAPPDWKVIEVERRWRVAIRSPKGRRVGWLTLQLDLVVERGNGRQAGVDHKTAGREFDSSFLDIDDQITGYVWGTAEATGKPVDEFVYNVLFKKAPQPPRQVTGTKAEPIKLSKAKDQPTTYGLFVAELERLNLDPTPYAEILEHFRYAGVRRERGAPADDPAFFAREGVFRTKGQLRAFAANLFEEWRDMKAVAAHPERAYPSPSVMNCRGCPIRAACQAMMDDADVGQVIRDQYVVLDPRR